MTRLYIQPSFLNSCEDHGEWSGGNDQYRGDRSVDLSTFDKNGRARMEAFSDEAVEALKQKNKPKISIADKILPQQKRVITLTNQMRELVADYKAGLYTVEEYSLLLDVVSAKRQRAEELLQRARSLKPVREEKDPQLYKNFSSSPTDSHEQNVANDVENVHRKTGFVSKIAGHSAVKDCIVFLGWSSVLLVAFKVFF